MLFTHFYSGRVNRLTPGHRDRTARVKATARGQVNGIRGLALQDDPLPAQPGIGRRRH